MRKSSDYAFDMVTLPLSGKRTGDRLRIIREKLDEMYKGEYSISKVAEQCGLTYHGLRKLESGDSEPRKSTVLILADFYRVDLSILYPNEGNAIELDMSFLLGKQEERDLFFDDYLAAWGQPHIMDPRRETQPDMFKSLTQEIDYDNNGNPNLDDISIEVSFRVFQNKTNTLVMNNVINDRTPISKDDIDPLQELIRQQVKILSEYYQKLKIAREQR